MTIETLRSVQAWALDARAAHGLTIDEREILTGLASNAGWAAVVLASRARTQAKREARQDRMREMKERRA